jgi:hypothetical protein
MRELMRELTWTQAEKKLSRQVFELALQVENWPIAAVTAQPMVNLNGLPRIVICLFEGRQRISCRGQLGYRLG